ncbi:MAG: FHA domain-containing protein [Myxococcales bacterium]|nr:FHA domain-containing protein [Myxococcales bacterium]
MAQLVVSLKGKEIARQPIQQVPFFFGSGEHNDFRLENPAISNTHFRIEYKDYRFFLVDTQSTNGTFFQQEKIQKTSLEKEDTWMVGKFSFKLDDMQVPPQESVSLEQKEMAIQHSLGTSKLTSNELKQVMRAALMSQQDDAPSIPPQKEVALSPTYFSELEKAQEQLQSGGTLIALLLAIFAFLLVGIWLGKMM